MGEESSRLVSVRSHNEKAVEQTPGCSLWTLRSGSIIG